MAFFKLQIDWPKFIEGGSGNDWESIRCPKNPGHQRAGRRVTDLIIDVVSWNVVDFSRTMLSEVVTDHALAVLRAANLSGFIVRPTRVATFPARVDRSKIPSLWEFVVTGQGGPAHKDSGIVKMNHCNACGLVRHSAYKNGIIVDTSTYDGSDFFAVMEYPRHILVSERAKSVIEDSRLTNVGFVESSKLMWPEGVIKPEEYR
jgi:hypothetical protein